MLLMAGGFRGLALPLRPGGLALGGRRFGRFCALWLYFHKGRLTLHADLVIIVGFALKGEEFCPAEALQVVCGVDDGPKTDWLAVCEKAGGPLVQVGTKFK